VHGINAHKAVRQADAPDLFSEQLTKRRGSNVSAFLL
jgi:hypothetical protein